MSLDQHFVSIFGPAPNELDAPEASLSPKTDGNKIMSLLGIYGSLMGAESIGSVRFKRLALFIFNIF